MKSHQATQGESNHAHFLGENLGVVAGVGSNQERFNREETPPPHTLTPTPFPRPLRPEKPCIYEPPTVTAAMRAELRERAVGCPNYLLRNYSWERLTEALSDFDDALAGQRPPGGTQRGIVATRSPFMPRDKTAYFRSLLR